MSNWQQALGTLGGAVIGFFTGGPMGALKGAYWGYMAGQIVAPTDLPTVRGPRLDDLKAQSSQVGMPVPMVFGTYAISGNVLWASDLIETKHKDTAGGKGSPSQKQISYTYSQCLAIGLCESALPGGAAIQGIRKIWANGKLIYDRTMPSQEVLDGAQTIDNGGTISEAIAEAVQNMTRSLAASDQLDQIMTVYDGTQVAADPLIESYEGVGNVPAYKDLAYVVFDNLQLADYGNRAPELLFEVYTSGSDEALHLDKYSNEVLYPWILGQKDPIDYRNTLTFESAGGGTSYSSLTGYMAGERPTWPLYVFCYRLNSNGNSITYPMEGDPSPYENVKIWIDVNCIVPDIIHDELFYWDSVMAGGVELVVALEQHQFVWWSGNYSSAYHHEFSGLFYAANTGNISSFNAAYATLPDPANDTGYSPYSPNAPYLREVPDQKITVERSPAPPLDTADNPAYTPLPDVPGYYVDQYGNMVRGAVWVYDNSTTYKVLQKYTVVAGVVTKYPLNPTRPSGHSQYNDAAFWTAAYDAAVAAGNMTGGLTYGVDYPVTQSFAYIDSAASDIIDVLPVAVADIVTLICRRSGLDVSQINVTDINSYVDGYVIATMMDGRAAIMPLAMYGMFSAFEGDGKIVFVERGGAVAKTFSEDELCAHVSGEDRPSSVAVTRKQDIELPRTVRVTYGSPSRDYQQGEQQTSRVITSALNSEDVQIPVSMSDTKALQLAEIYMFDAWTARNSYTFLIGQQNLARTPTDIVQIPVDGVTERVRIISIDLALAGVLACEAVRDDSDVLTSYASVIPGEVVASATPSELALPGPTDLVLLDLPSLRYTDNDAGYYAAGRGYLPTWSGFAILQSFNGGTEYIPVAHSTDAATMGSITAAFNGGSSTITVELVSGSFSAATSAELDSGANLLAIGAHGRWELLQFGTASLSAGVWTLGSLRRGLRGTTAYEATNVIGDRVVLMSGKGILRIPLSASLVGVTHLVKAVSTGNTIDSTAAVSFTSAGLSLQSGGLTYDGEDMLIVNPEDADNLIARQVFGP